jgi:uncharacterized membrane protein (Fun14 family)
MLPSLRVVNEMDVYIRASENKALDSGAGLKPYRCLFCSNTRTAATTSSGFFVGILIEYALKKVIKLLAVIVGLFLSTLAYLQHQQIAIINWNKFQHISEDAITTLTNLMTQIQSISGVSADSHAAASLSMNSFGIPFTR